jgi:hypothetical protein
MIMNLSGNTIETRVEHILVLRYACFGGLGLKTMFPKFFLALIQS